MERISKKRIESLERETSALKQDILDLEDKNRFETKLIKDKFDSEKDILLS